MDDDARLPDEAFDLVYKTPQRRKGPAHDPRLLANIDEVRSRADGRWHRIGRYLTVQGAHTRAVALRKNAEYKDRFEFHENTIDVEEPYKSALFCKWKGAKGKPGRKVTQPAPEPAPLRVIRGGADDRPPTAANEE